MTLEEMTSLYAALGDRGQARPLQDGTVSGFALTRRFVRAETAQRVVEILRGSPSPAGRAPSQLVANAPQIAFKTGTSYGFRDAWSFGIGGGYAIGVWVGRPDGAPRPGATGREAALPILFEAFDLLDRAPEPARREEHDQRAAPALVRLESNGDDGGLSILFPPANTEVLVLDYGPNSRGLSLSARGGQGDLTWYAEGHRVDTEPTSGRAIWRPSAPGFHDVTVIDGAGQRAQVRVRIRNSG